MTGAMLKAVLDEASAKEGKDGERELAERRMTLYVAHDGATLTIGRIEGLRQDGDILRARNDKGERYFVALEDVFAASLDAAQSGASARKAGCLG